MCLPCCTAAKEIRPIAAKQIDEVSTKQKTTIYLLSRSDAAKPTERAQPVADGAVPDCGLARVTATRHFL